MDHYYGTIGKSYRFHRKLKTISIPAFALLPLPGSLSGNTILARTTSKKLTQGEPARFEKNLVFQSLPVSFDSKLTENPIKKL